MKMHYLILLLLFSGNATAQMESTPCPRNQPVIAYHQQEMAIFLFGGYCSKDKRRLNDLWKFDGQSWVLIATEDAPSPRSGHSMVFDTFENRLLVFGGKNDNGDLLNDTWVWDGAKWDELHRTGPIPRQSHRMAYDTKNQAALLFGGSDKNGNALNDTWLFKDGNWMELKLENPPPARLQHTLSYDPLRDVMVLFGGFNRTNGEKQIFGDTWEWRLSEGWVLKADNQQLARDHHAMAYDMGHERTILFGGYNEGYLGDAWSWDGNEWTKLNEDSAIARAGKPGLIYDSMKEVIVLFGGWDRSNQPLMDFWQFNTNQYAWDHY